MPPDQIVLIVWPWRPGPAATTAATGAGLNVGRGWIWSAFTPGIPTRTFRSPVDLQGSRPAQSPHMGIATPNRLSPPGIPQLSGWLTTCKEEIMLHTTRHKAHIILMSAMTMAMASMGSMTIARAGDDGPPLSATCAAESGKQCWPLTDPVERTQCYSKVYFECMANGGPVGGR